MNVRFNLRHLKPGLDTLGYAVDILMIVLVFLNLLLLTLDWLFGFPAISGYLAHKTPRLYELYHPIHEDFLRYDLMFVAVYLTEFLIGWVVEVARGTYHRWFFYPFVRWYDLLGCIPIGALRWLRLLRIFSLLYRLQRMKIIDFSETLPGKFILKYYGVLIEELSDRVVINVLEGAQREINEGNPLIHRIQSQVIAPRRDDLVHYLTERIIETAHETHQNYRQPLAEYLSQLIDIAVTNSRNGARIAAIPIAGPKAIALLGDTTQDVATALLDQIIKDLENPENRTEVYDLINQLLDHMSGERHSLEESVRTTLLEVIEQIKAQVRLQQWKLRDQQEN